MPPKKQSQMTPDELRKLPVSVDLETAGRAFGLGRSWAHELAARGEFPCSVIEIKAVDGRRRSYRVSRAAIYAALGEDPGVPLPADEPSSAA